MKLTIVTAGDAAYFRCADQLLRSAQRQGLHQGPQRFVCVDLGLTARQRLALQRRYPWCELRRFDFSRAPAHAALSQRNYAWKPLLIAGVAADGEPLLWLDSATLFHVRDLAHVRKQLADLGLYTLRGRRTLREACDREVLVRTCAQELWLERIHVSGVVGIDPAHPGAMKVLADWCDMARDPSLNLPPGAVHSADQSLLSIALHRAAARGEVSPNDEEIDISSFAPVRWMSSRNKVKAWMPYAADPLVRCYYRAYKAIDQTGLYARHLHATRLSGWHRSLREHYSVRGVRPKDGAGLCLTAPKGRYWADPFVWRTSEATWILLEELSFASNRGRLIAVPLDGALRPGPPEVALELTCHVSFPFVFSHGGVTYLVPETSHQRTVDLYACERFPTRWRLARRLLADVDAADSVVFTHAGLFWLLTSQGSEGERHLALYYSDDLLDGRWHEHPVTRERRYRGSVGHGRNGGNVVSDARGLRRIMQSSTRRYGESVTPMRIEALSPERFSEQIDVGSPWRELAARAHHLCVTPELVVWDTRERF